METKSVNFSIKEKERRWSLVRQSMANEGLDAIVFYGSTQYLTNVFGTINPPPTFIFPLDQEPVIVFGRLRNVYFAEQASWIMKENIHQSSNIPAEVAKQLKALKLQNKRLGIDNLGAWPARQYLALRELSPKAELVETGTLMAKIMGPKSSEELKLINEGLRISELAQRTFLANLKLGRNENEVVGKVNEVIAANGGSGSLLHLMSANTLEMPWPYEPGTRPASTIRKPNPITFSPEFHFWGYLIQAVRAYAWEEPKGEHKKMWELYGEVEKLALRELRPGAKFFDIGAKLERLIGDAGYECDYLGHGVGLAGGGAGYITSGPSGPKKQPGGAQWTIQENEIFTVHPMITRKGGKPPLCFVADMYLVGKNSTKNMTPFLPGLPEIIPG